MAHFARPDPGSRGAIFHIDGADHAGAALGSCLRAVLPCPWFVFLCAQKFDISNFNFSFGIFSTGLKKIGCNFHNKQNFLKNNLLVQKVFDTESRATSKNPKTEVEVGDAILD